MLNMMPQVIEEETSDEDNSSNGSNKDKNKNDPKALPMSKTQSEKPKDTQISAMTPTYRKGGDDNLSFVKSQNDKQKSISKNLEEDKVATHDKNSTSFQDIRDNYDSIRKHHSGSCKSAAASLKFSKHKKRLVNKISSSPMLDLTRKSHHLSTTTAKDRKM